MCEKSRAWERGCGIGKEWELCWLLCVYHFDCSTDNRRWAAQIECVPVSEQAREKWETKVYFGRSSRCGAHALSRTQKYAYVYTHMRLHIYPQYTCTHTPTSTLAPFDRTETPSHHFTYHTHSIIFTLYIHWHTHTHTHTHAHIPSNAIGLTASLFTRRVVFLDVTVELLNLLGIILIVSTQREGVSLLTCVLHGMC